jgi:hypothetical protein
MHKNDADEETCVSCGDCPSYVSTAKVDSLHARENSPGCFRSGMELYQPHCSGCVWCPPWHRCSGYRRRYTARDIERQRSITQTMARGSARSRNCRFQGGRDWVGEQVGEQRTAAGKMPIEGCSSGSAICSSYWFLPSDGWQLELKSGSNLIIQGWNLVVTCSQTPLATSAFNRSSAPHTRPIFRLQAHQTTLKE